MEITEVRIHLRNEEKLKAYATITIDKCFVVRDLKVIQGNTGMFVAMPSRKKPDGTFKDIAHPLDNDTRKMLETKILEAYREELLKLKDQVVKVDEATAVRTVETPKPAAPVSAVSETVQVPAAAAQVTPTPAPAPAIAPVPVAPVPPPVSTRVNPVAAPAPTPGYSRQHPRETARKMTMEEWAKSIEDKINGNK